MITLDNIIIWGPIVLPIIINILIIIKKVLEIIATIRDFLVWFFVIIFTLIAVDVLALAVVLPWLVHELNRFAWSPGQFRLWIAVASAAIGSVYPLFWGMYCLPVLRRIFIPRNSKP